MDKGLATGGISILRVRSSRFSVVIFKYLPIVAVRLSLVAPEGAPAKVGFHTTERLVIMVMGPIVEPPQDRYLQRRCSIKNVYT
jgi:hypothetical protein